MCNSYFVTGTDTNIGKTLVSAILCHQLQYPYWKPIQSGLINGDNDAEFVKNLTGMQATISIGLQQPLSPHVAADIDAVSIDLHDIICPYSTPHIAEGAGGVLVPINDRNTMIDLMKALDYPVIVVARSELGTINHTCLTVQCLRNNGLTLAGVVMVGDKNPSNKHAIEKYGNVRVIAEIPLLNDIQSEFVNYAIDV